MENDLGSIGWQISVFALIFVAGIGAFWTAKQYRTWLGRKLGEPRKWAAISSVGVGVATFVVLAVILGFVIDTAASV